jgi:signal transduction histidine kinase
MHSFLGVPITVRGRVVGDLYLTEKRGAPEFSAADQAIVEMFALHAGIAIENARLHEEVQRLAVVEERERIGQDLHDSIIQSLYALSLALEDVPELMADDPAEAHTRIDRAIDGLHLAIRDIRNFIFGLRPERLGQVGLVGGLATVVDEYRLNTMVDIELAADEDIDAELPPDVVIQLVKIAQEALSNIARHAGATRARVSVGTGPAGAATGGEEGREVVLEIADNGIGFDPDEARSEAHRGIRNVRARVASLGGRLVVLSEPGAGTRIIVHVPYPRDA